MWPNSEYPAPLQLYRKDQPLVTHATHLGHELHQECSMNMTIKMKRVTFSHNSFALPY
jgi:hypothetical protein